MLTTLPHAKRPESLPDETENVVERAEITMRQVRELQGMPVIFRFDNGTLSLYGCVNSFHAKQLAQTAAAEIPGITRIQNQLEVVSRR